jgi:hypothetical protein
MLENLQDPAFRESASSPTDTIFNDEPSPPYSAYDPASSTALVTTSQSGPLPTIPEFNDPAMAEMRRSCLKNLMEMQERVDKAIEIKIENASPPNRMTPTDIINLARAYRLANGESTYGLSEMLPATSSSIVANAPVPVPVIPPPRPKRDWEDKENNPPRLSFSAANPPTHIFNREPVQVFSVHLPLPPVPIPFRDFKRPPTPYPEEKNEELMIPSSEIPEFKCKIEEVLRFVSPPPSYIFNLTPTASSPPPSFDENLPRTLLGLDTKSQPLAKKEVKKEDGIELPHQRIPNPSTL